MEFVQSDSQVEPISNFLSKKDSTVENKYSVWLLSVNIGIIIIRKLQQPRIRREWYRMCNREQEQMATLALCMVTLCHWSYQSDTLYTDRRHNRDGHLSPSIVLHQELIQAQAGYSGFILSTRFNLIRRMVIIANYIILIMATPLG